LEGKKRGLFLGKKKKGGGEVGTHRSGESTGKEKNSKLEANYNGFKGDNKTKKAAYWG